MPGIFAFVFQIIRLKAVRSYKSGKDRMQFQCRQRGSGIGKALGLDIEKAIDADVHHLQRLGLDAFRVHVWDVEISDSAGNLLDNEHLRLFDYLLWKLKENNIKILITPIAFWGNGYPERDEKNAGVFY